MKAPLKRISARASSQRIPSYWYSRDYLRAFGAEPVDERVVIDRNRATGGGMTAGIDFGLEMVRQWAALDAGQLTELSMEYAPRPPFGTGLPELAPPHIFQTAHAILSNEMPNALVHAAAVRRGFEAG